jgi:hypothetical protein
LSDIWNAIIYDFIDGWPHIDGKAIGPTERDKELIKYFISRPRFTQLLNKFIQDEVKKVILLNVSNNTKVIL